MLTLPQAMERGFAAYQRGDLPEAERLCRAVLNAKTDHFDALHLLGIIAARTRRTREAAELLSRALSSNPNDAAAHSHLGNVLRALKRPAEALQSYERALALEPDYAEAYYNRGNALGDLERHADALESYERALALMPDLAEAHNNRGMALNALNRHSDALESYERALALNPDYPEAHNNRGVALFDLKRYEEALESCGRALALKPDYAEAYNNRGIALGELKRPAEALQSYERALALEPDYAEAYYNRGNALGDLERHADALESYERALALMPDLAEAHNNRGMALNALNRHSDALESYERALALNPDYPEAYNNRGIALFDLKRYAEALESYGRALALKPDYASAHWNQALCQLLLGDFVSGWQEYEWRLKEGHQADPGRNLVQPLWLGAQTLKGKTILLQSEQGFGDTLQFCRYAKEVAALGAKVLLEVRPPLVQLLADLEGVTQVLQEGNPLPAFDYHCPLMSLPLAFKTDLQNIPSSIPYIRSDPARVAAWREELGIRAKPRVGLAWSGSIAHKNDHNRSMALAEILPLVCDWAEWISLQKDVGESDAALLASRADLRHVGGELTDFADTAALVELMDVVVTVDTSVAHLAGAMGKPVWILLPCNPDWRWLLDREDSLWYPTARLFRQPAIGDWGSAIRRLREELEGQFRARS